MPTIDLRALRSTALRREPFDWALVDGAIPEDRARTLLSEFPTEEFWVISDDDGEKDYTYAARPLVTLGARDPSAPSSLSDAWRELASDLLSDEYRRGLSELIDRPLDDALMEASVWRWDAGMQLGPHLDMASKIVTQVFYLSRRWDPSWGGGLRILGSRQPGDVVAELPPHNGSASVLVRSERSWHSVAPVAVDAPESRRSVIVTWFAPGSSSPVWGVGDGGDVACVAGGSVRERPRRDPQRVRSPRGVAATLAAAAPQPRRSRRPTPAPGANGANQTKARVRTRVAMVGTFDVANFGDLLLPLIAEHELQERLGDGFDLVPYSYRPLSGEGWPFQTRDLGRLAAEIGDFDLLLIGGGQIVRFDTAFPSGYGPSDATVQHPLGLWLTPTLLATSAGVPVAWNAPGVADTIPTWLDPLIGTAIAATAYTAVRDELSARLLGRSAPDAAIKVVPDTGFGIAGLLAPEPSEDFEALVGRLGLGNGYVALQASEELLGDRDAILHALSAARERGLAVLELPFGPVHGDRPGALGALGETVTPGDWPDPVLMAELVARADVVIAQSFHAGVVAAACGVPLLRPASPAGWKYESLQGLPGVHALGDSGMSPGAAIDQRGQLAGAADHRARLAAHWDAIAACLEEERGERPQPVPALAAAIPALVGRTVSELAAHDQHVAGLHEQIDAAAARVHTLEADLGALLAQRSTLATQTDTLGLELAQARSRVAALEAVRDRRVVRGALALARLLGR